MASRAASVLLLIAAATAAFSATVLLPTVQAETNALRRDVSYEPASPDFFVGYIDDRDTKDDAAATSITGNRRVRPSAWIRYARRGIDFPFVEDASSEDSPVAVSSSSSSSSSSNSNSNRNRNLGKLWPADRALLERFVKRNIDEIDRTAFDNFFKRNIDEIDRVGWDGFVKRFANYLTTAVTWPNRPKSLKLRPN
ncbi:Orcokinin peptides [Anthophora quadrimaculata]